MLNSEILNTFDESRPEFRPYGLTCEQWIPNRMRKPDRHNEIELNYFPAGTMTYLFQHRKITVVAHQLTVFWGLIPHQIIHYEGGAPYYICTIPLSQFLEWNLPATFVDRILRGEVLSDGAESRESYDVFLFKNWLRDMKNNFNVEVTLLEMRARLARMVTTLRPGKEGEYLPAQVHELGQVERIAVYIAQNYHHPVKASAIGTAVGLHPDYANSIFKKAFGSTLSEYILEERISHAQRKLVTTTTGITEISFECGFNSISRFNAAFLHKNGCTPRQFRKHYL